MNPLTASELLAHRDFARALARRLVRDTATAEDVAQQAMVELVEVGRPVRVRPWLKSVVHHASRRLIRRERRRREIEVLQQTGERATPAAAEIAERLELQRRLTERVLALEPKARDVILLHFYDGKSVARTAEELEIPFETARTRLRRALADLRAHWNGDHGGEREGTAALALLARWPTSKELIEAAATMTASSVLASGVFVMTTKAKVIAAAVVLAAVGTGVVLSSSGRGDPPRVAGRGDGVTQRIVDPSSVSTPAAAEIDGAVLPMRAAETSGNEVQRPGRGSLLVRVVWSRDGTPASDIEVACDQGRGRILRRTNSDGIVVLEGLEAGRASVAGDRGGRTTATVEAGQQAEVTLELPIGITIQGRVEDSRGGAVSGAEVWLSEGTNFVMGHVVARSGSDGTFSIRDVSGYIKDLLEGPQSDRQAVTTGCLVGARARGFIPSDLLTLDASVDWKLLRLVLPGRGASLTGRVIDPHGEPVPRATVILSTGSRGRVNTRDSQSNGGMAAVTIGSQYCTTDGSGRFDFLGWPAGASWLVARATEWAVSSERIDLQDGAEAYREIHLRAGVTVKGVVSRPDGDSTAFVLVRSRSEFSEGSAFTYTARNGSYTLAGVPAGEFEIEAESRDSRVSAPLHGREGETISWSPILSSGAQIQGLLLDEAQTPLEGWLIDAVDESHRRPVPSAGTDVDGAFALKSLDPNGTYRLTARGGPIAAWSIEHVRPGSPVRMVVPSDRKPSCTIEGRVVDPGGNHVGGARVLLETNLGRAEITADGEDGTFRIDRLTPGSYSVVIRAQGFSEVRVEDHDLRPNESWKLGALSLARE